MESRGGVELSCTAPASTVDREWWRWTSAHRNGAVEATNSGMGGPPRIHCPQCIGVRGGAAAPFWTLLDPLENLAENKNEKVRLFRRDPTKFESAARDSCMTVARGSRFPLREQDAGVARPFHKSKKGTPSSPAGRSRQAALSKNEKEGIDWVSSGTGTHTYPTYPSCTQAGMRGLTTHIATIQPAPPGHQTHHRTSHPRSRRRASVLPHTGPRPGRCTIPCTHNSRPVQAATQRPGAPGQLPTQGKFLQRPPPHPRNTARSSSTHARASTTGAGTHARTHASRHSRQVLD